MIGVGFVHFRTCELAHLDAAWLTLSRQSFEGVGHVVFLDNNTTHDPDDLATILDRYPLPVPVIRVFDKHGDPSRTQSWSVNRVVNLVQAEWVFFTRTDFLLDYDCLARFRAERDRRPGWCGFVTSYCQQMGYDEALSNVDALAPHSAPDALWRHDSQGPKILTHDPTVPSHYFRDTEVDAGVWLMVKTAHREAGGLNERMTSWGFQQQVFQRRLRARGVEIVAIPEYLYHHQHHWAPRDFERARQELRHE